MLEFPFASFRILSLLLSYSYMVLELCRLSALDLLLIQRGKCNLGAPWVIQAGFGLSSIDFGCF
jgi:hypothetical protein